MSMWWWVGIAFVVLIVLMAVVYFFFRAIVEAGERADDWYDVEVPKTAEIPTVGLTDTERADLHRILHDDSKLPSRVRPRKPTAHGKRPRKAKASKPKKTAAKSRKAK